MKTHKQLVAEVIRKLDALTKSPPSKFYMEDLYALVLEAVTESAKAAVKEVKVDFTPRYTFEGGHIVGYENYGDMAEEQQKKIDKYFE